MKAIHNIVGATVWCKHVVSNIKDINFWKHFTTIPAIKTTKIGCFEYQRYKLLKAIHNTATMSPTPTAVVSNIKDINFWKQFTTNSKNYKLSVYCFEYQRYKLLKAIHNELKELNLPMPVVSNIKDINFWKQFTTV